MPRAPVVEVSSGRASADPFREEVLRAARTFKASWTGLARVLTRVRDEALWEGWRFPSFEAYCSKELRHPQGHRAEAHPVVELSRPARARLEAGRETMLRPAPAFEVVEVLAEAEERGALDAAEYRSIRDSIWDPERPVAAVRRELTERFPRPASRARPRRRCVWGSWHERRAGSPRSCGCAAGFRRRCRTQADDLAAAVESLAVERRPD